MSEVWTVCRRELGAVFANPVAAIFVLAFVGLSAALTFHLGGFFARGRADLIPFFRFHPWLHLVLMPALAMRLWAEERNRGTLELLVTLPLRPGALVLGKFLAAWLVAGLALALTAGLPITVAVLGTPDPGPMVSGYLGSWLLAGGFLAVSAAASAATRNQAVAFVLGAGLCLLLLAPGTELAAEALTGLGLAPGRAAMAVSLLVPYDTLVDGHVTVAALGRFAVLIAVALFINLRLVTALEGR